MSWQTPKTDWKSEDFFNVQDYNRIKNNLYVIQSIAQEVISHFYFEDMGPDKRYTDYGFYADEINCFERNIENIRTGVFPFAVGSLKTYYENQPFINWEELNRIEKACELIYSNIQSLANGRKMLAFTLNGGDF